MAKTTSMVRRVVRRHLYAWPLAFLAVSATHAADDGQRCRDQLSKLDVLLQRAKLTQATGVPVSKARADAAAHRAAGRHAACVASVTSAWRVLGRAP
jgi:hypothetical protein